MPAQTDTIHNEIVSALNTEISNALDTFENIIEEKKKECETGTVPNGAAYDSFVRNVRKRALSQLNGIKTWIGAYIRSSIIQQVRSSGVSKLQEVKNSITEAEAEKQKAIAEKQRIIKNSSKLSDYEKYSLYGHPEFTQSAGVFKKKKGAKNSSAPVKKVSPNVELAYQKYQLKKRQSLTIGLIVTTICVIVDFSMLYALFLSANYPTLGAMIIAVISAAVLDGPPYVLGYAWTKSDDDDNLLELQGNENTPEARRKKTGNTILLVVMLIVIILAFIAYLSVRILSFWGGGDFSLTLHAIIEKNWSAFKDIEFSGADFLSTMIPLATSVVAMAVGKLVYSLKTDYIKESIVAIKDELNQKVKACDEKVIAYEKRIKDLKDSLITLKREIWTFYLGRKPFPASDDSFRLEVALAFQKLNLPLYKQTYSDCCLLLRNQAVTLLESVNDQLSLYAADPTRIINMDFSKDEKQCLDDYWVISSDGTPQGPTTQLHLDEIEKNVADILKTLT